MSKEAPFISKALKLVSLALILATVAIAATAAYSGYEEYGALRNTIERSSAGQLSLSINGSSLVISGLTVPNRMTFPLTLELLGNVSLDNTTVGNFDSGAYVIQPNESQSLDISVPLNFVEVLQNSNVLKQALFNSSEISITTVISAGVVPLLGINITNSANTISGPILGDLQASLNTSDVLLSPDGENVQVPLLLSWQNSSPFSTGALWMNANLTEIPGKPTGNYGSTSGLLNLKNGQNEESFLLTLPLSDFSGKTLPASGPYIVQIDLSQSESSHPIIQITKQVSV